jgi:hypothetical protein
MTVGACAMSLSYVVLFYDQTIAPFDAFSLNLAQLFTYLNTHGFDQFGN